MESAYLNTTLITEIPPTKSGTVEVHREREIHERPDGENRQIVTLLAHLFK